MNTTTTETNVTYTTKLQCKLFGHQYRITKRYASNAKEFQCACCNKEMSIDAYGNQTDLTASTKKHNETLEKFFAYRRTA